MFVRFVKQVWNSLCTILTLASVLAPFAIKSMRTLLITPETTSKKGGKLVKKKYLHFVRKKKVLSILLHNVLQIKVTTHSNYNFNTLTSGS